MSLSRHHHRISDIPPLIGWESPPPVIHGVVVEEIEWFYTRDLRRLFGVIHHIGSCAYSLEMWRDRQWLLFVRFTCTRPGSRGRSFLVRGYVPDESISEVEHCGSEQLVPQEIRALFEEYLGEG